MKGLNIPERFTGTIYIYMDSDPSSVLYGLMFFGDADPSDRTNKILLGKVDVDVPLDAAGSLDKQVANLRAGKQRIIDEASEKARQIDDAIESLLAIEYKGDGE